MNSSLEQLHDIQGLDLISRWPLAVGWWVVIVLGAIALSGIVYGIVRKVAFIRSWKNDTMQKLAYLEKNLSDATARETAIVLSEYLRRIALRRFSREECAGLIGEAWLKWLTAKDPKGFDWEKKGALLIEVPYAPKDAFLSTDLVRDVIQAIRNWVR